VPLFGDVNLTKDRIIVMEMVMIPGEYKNDPTMMVFDGVKWIN
tara:strand:- start:1052 stop:1180 length:129 start_codon:yes stop_codon:yes gene_type:complete